MRLKGTWWYDERSGLYKAWTARCTFQVSDMPNDYGFYEWRALDDNGDEMEMGAGATVRMAQHEAFRFYGQLIAGKQLVLA